MKSGIRLGRRAFGGVMAGLASAAAARIPAARASAPDGAGAVSGMIASLEAAQALSFTANQTFGASVARDRLRTLGTRASVVFQRSGTLFAVFGEGGGPDVQLLIAGGEATLFRLSLGARSVLTLAPENGAAFAVPGVFIPFLGLLGADVTKDFFGAIQSVTPIAQGAPGQPEETTLAAVMGERFTGEVWVGNSSGRPAQVTGTWFGAKGDLAASAAVSLTGWSSEPPAAGAFAVKGLAESKLVDLAGLGL